MWISASYAEYVKWKRDVSSGYVKGGQASHVPACWGRRLCLAEGVEIMIINSYDGLTRLVTSRQAWTPGINSKVAHDTFHRNAARSCYTIAGINYKEFYLEEVCKCETAEDAQKEEQHSIALLGALNDKQWNVEHEKTVYDKSWG